MDFILAKLLIEIPDVYKYLLDYKLTLIEVEESFDYEPPAVPHLTLTFVRTEQHGDS